MTHASCQDLIYVVNRYLADTVTLAEQATIAHHLLACQSCRKYLESYKNTVHIAQPLGHRPKFTIGQEHVSESMIAAILAKRAKKRK